MQTKISICMMVKDEEKNLPRCLNSLKPLIDVNLAELIIVDTGSKDNTVDIAKKYTDKVYFHLWNNDFSSMRNKTISYARGEWIFIIDADEELVNSEELINLINSKGIKNFNTIVLQVKSFNDLNNMDVAALNPSPRLFRNDGEVQYVGAVHNQPLFKDPLKVTSITLNHYGYIITDKELMDKKYNRTKAILESELEKNPSNIYYQFQLAVTYDMHGDYREAYNQFQKAYLMLKNESDSVKLEKMYLYSAFARSASLNKMYQVVIDICSEGIRIRKDFIDLYYILGVTLRQVGDLEGSIEILMQYLNLVNNYEKLEIAKDLSISLYNMDEASIENATFNLILNYLDLQNYSECKKYITKLKKDDKKFVSYSKLISNLENEDELLQLYNEIDFNYKLDINEVIENKVESFGKGKQDRFRRIFSSLTDEYGLYNFILAENSSKQYTDLEDAVVNYSEKYNLNKSKGYIGNIVRIILHNKQDIYSFLHNVTDDSIDRFLKYCYAKKDKMDDVIISFLESVVSTHNEIDYLRIKRLLLKNLLLFSKNKKSLINRFDDYCKTGLGYLELVYRSVIIEDEVVSTVSDEVAFLIFMHKANKNKEVNEVEYVRYLSKALAAYPYFKDYIEVLKEELENAASKNNIFSKYKAELKDNVKLLIENGRLEDAKAVLCEYEKIVEKDIDVYSMKAVIAIMESNFDDAERILEDGLSIEPQNQDLLFNLSYVKNIRNEQSKAIELYSAAKMFNPSSTTKIEEIISDLKPINNNSLRVLSGTMEIANQINTITTGLKRLGVDAKSLNYYSNYLGYKSDFTLEVNKMNSFDLANIESKKLAAKLISSNDVFHFHFGKTLSLDYTDLPVLKELNKKVLMHHWGSDVRLHSRAIEFSPFVKVKNTNEYNIKKNLELLSKYISHCIVADYELYEYVKDFYENVHIVNQAIDLEKYQVNSYSNNKFLIVHAPSSPEFKGTKYILSAVEELKDKYDFEFKLIQGMPHEEAKKIYQRADLIIDQILCGSYGLFSIEAMAMGKPVICFISDYMKGKYPDGLPIISSNPDNIREKIEYALKNRDELVSIGKRSREYVEKHHDMNSISKAVLELYKSI